MHAEHFLDAEPIEQTVPQHRPRAGAALLGRLEDHHGGSGEITRFGEVFRGTEQHGGVPIMPAGVHFPRHG